VDVTPETIELAGLNEHRGCEASADEADSEAGWESWPGGDTMAGDTTAGGAGREDSEAFADKTTKVEEDGEASTDQTQTIKVEVRLAFSGVLVRNVEFRPQAEDTVGDLKRIVA